MDQRTNHRRSYSPAVTKSTAMIAHKSTAAMLQRWQIKRWRNLFALGPVVIGVAFKAARFRVVRSGRVTRLARRDSRHHYIRGERASQRLRVAAYAGKSRVRLMIEFRV